MGKNRNQKTAMSRSKFLGFLGKIGLLSLIPGIPAYAEEIIIVRQRDGFTKLKSLSPMIKGKALSANALEAKLSTRNLENIRDLLTGRFFGRITERRFRNGYVPLINWNLGVEGSDTGCFLFAELAQPGYETSSVDNCVAHMVVIEGFEEDSIQLHLGGSRSRVPDCEDCTCHNACPNVATEINFHEFVSYPGDKFVTEITDILKTTDVSIIRNELKNVIFSDETLNMGLQHFVLAAHDVMIDDIEEGITTH